MAEAFDPYYIWLGIPPEEQPADYYRLLGVRRFETNLEVIANAADQRVRHLRSMQTGKRQAETQRLLNEISSASGTLLDPDKRKEYDAKLRAKEAVQITRSATIQPAPLRTATPIPVAGTLPAPLSPKPIVEAHGQALAAAPSPITAPSQFLQIVSPRAHRKSSRTIWIAIGGAACVAIAVALIGTVALTIMARRTATDTPLVAEQPAKNPGVPANTRGPQIGEKPPSVSFPPNLKQAEGTASSGPPVVGKSSDPAGGGNFVPTKVVVTARDAQKSGKTTARFVRIELPGKAKFLNLAEVQVYSGSENVAVKGNATQSSTGYYGYAKLANDGNTNGQYYDSKSVSCTNLEDNPWWEVDLGAEKVLDKIVVWNRTDGGMDARLQGYKLLALDASRNVVWQVSPAEYPKPSSEFALSGISEATPATEPVKLTRYPIPDDVALTTARATLKETFGDLSQISKKPDEKLKLSAELSGVADSEKDPAIRYALLDAARRLAVSGQDMRAALFVAGEIARQYETDPLDQQLLTLNLTAGTSMPADAWEAAAEFAGELATAAQDCGRLELADRASQLAMEHAEHSRDVEFKKSIKQMRDRVTAQLKLWEVAKAAEKSLQTSPDDPAANLAVGKWYCLHLGDWEKGIPHLAKSGEAKLAAAAVAEKDAKLFPAADAWSAAAEALTGAEQLAAQRHALELYQKASERLKGLEQLKAAKRVTEMTELLAQSESQTASAGGIAPRTKVATDELRPGLLVRIYASQPPAVPTPALGIIHSYGDFALRRDQLAKDLQFASQRLAFAGTGYIDLDKDETITFHIRNGICLVDGNRILSNNPDLPTKAGAKKKKNKNPDEVKRLLKRGRHSVQILPFDANSDGPNFRITREGGTSAISYSPSDLDAELAKPILFHGTSAKGRFSLGNR
jgi:hypothetical protein